MKNRPFPLTLRVEEDSQEYTSPNRQTPSIIHNPASSNFGESQDDRGKLEQSGALGHVVEFQQFVPEEERQEQGYESNLITSSVKSWIQEEIKEKNKKKFVIQIPKEEESTIRFKGGFLSQEEKVMPREPPAPSNKKWTKNRAFVFPNSSSFEQSPEKDEPKEVKNNISELIKSFDRERQQFYRQKSRLEKELLVKEGQIEILQKTMTNLLGGDSQSLLNNSPQYYESIILEKEKQLESLFNKISQLNQQLSSRGQELVSYKNENNKLKHDNETLANQLFLFQNMRQPLYVQPEFTICSEQYSQPSVQMKKDDGLNLLEKRLEVLSFHRKEYEDKNKIKTSSFYSRGSNVPTRQLFDTLKQPFGLNKRK